MNTQILVFIIMYGILAICSIPLRKKTGYYPLLLMGLAFLGAIVSGLGIPIREVVQGTFGYFDEFLAMAVGAVLVGILFVNGTFDLMIQKSLKIKNNLMKTYILLLIVAIPSILTGLVSISLLTTARLVQNAMNESDIDKSKIIGFSVVGSLIGAILPPVNAISMIITLTSYHAYYSGFSLILLLIGLPVFLVYGFLASKDMDKVKSNGESDGSIVCIVPLVIVLVLVIGHDFLFTVTPFLGYPLIYLIGTVLALLISPNKANLLEKFTEMYSNFIIPLATVLSIGMFMEIVLMTGIPGMSSAYLFGVSGNMLILASMVIILIIGYFLGGPLPILFGALVASFGSNINETISQVTFLALSIIVIVSLVISNKSRAQSITNENIGEQSIKLDKNAYIAIGLIVVIVVVLAVLGSSAEPLIL